MVQWLRLRLAVSGDTGSIPGQGRFHMLRSNKVHVLQLLSPRAATTEPTCLRKPMLYNRRRHVNEKPTHLEEEWPLFSANRERPSTAKSK